MQKIIAAGGLVVNEKEEILLIYRRKFWDLPKGKLDEGESIEACAIREVKEEVGLNELTLEKFLTKTYHTYFDKWINAEVEKETWWYVMKTSSAQVLQPQTEEDIEEVIWVNKNDLDKYLTQTFESIKMVIEKYFMY